MHVLELLTSKTRWRRAIHMLCSYTFVDQHHILSKHSCLPTSPVRPPVDEEDGVVIALRNYVILYCISCCYVLYVLLFKFDKTKEGILHNGGMNAVYLPLRSCSKPLVRLREREQKGRPWLNDSRIRRGAVARQARSICSLLDRRDRLAP